MWQESCLQLDMTISVHLFLLFLTSEFWGKQNSYALSYNAVSNWKSSSQLYYPGILSTWFMCCLEEECMHIFQSILLWITYFHCPLFFQQWTWNMPFSCNLDSYSRQNVNMRTAPKTKVKVKNCARSEWPSNTLSVYCWQVLVYMCRPN